MITRDSIKAALDAYVFKLNETHAQGNMYNYSVTEGSKRFKIVEHFNFSFNHGGGQTAVFCFIDKTNGDILKAETLYRPAKGKRGNIFDEKLPMTLGDLYIR